MDPAIIGLLVFAFIVLAVIWVYRRRIKIAIKGPAGISLELEAENAPPSQAPNAAGTKQTGDRSVAAGRDITGSGRCDRPTTWHDSPRKSHSRWN